MTDVRYLAMPISVETERHRQIADQLGLVRHRVGEMLVYLSRSAMAIARIGRNAIVVGRLFDASGDVAAQASAVLEAAECEPDRLLRLIWGDYVVIRDAAGRTEAYRAPAGRLPAYWVSRRGGIILSSDCDLLIAMGFADGRIAWNLCLRHLVDFETPLETTALASILEVRPGYALRHVADRPSQAVWWNPWHFAAWPDERSAPQQADDLRERIEHAVRAQLKPFSSLLVRVSGGLDSSIVATCLSESDDRARLMVLVAGDGEGDERHHARSVAARLGRPLLEMRYGLEDVDLEEPSYPGLPVPRGRHLAPVIGRISERALDTIGAGAVVTGFGGDALFAMLMSVRPIIDRLRMSGPLAATRTLLDIALMTSSSLLETGHKSLRFLRRGTWAYTPTMIGTFLDPEQVRAVAHRPERPSAAPSAVLPGKAMQIAMILGSLKHLDPPSVVGLPEIPALLAQPVIEACLAIPTWSWCSGGRDRAIARMAFHDRLPPSILDRRSKGGPDPFCASIVERHRHDLRARLLDGVLAREGLLDRHAIDDCLKGERPIPMGETLRLLQLSDAEAWIGERQRRAQALRPATRPA